MARKFVHKRKCASQAIIFRMAMEYAHKTSNPRLRDYIHEIDYVIITLQDRTSGRRL